MTVLGVYRDSFSIELFTLPRHCCRLGHYAPWFSPMRDKSGVPLRGFPDLCTLGACRAVSLPSESIPCLGLIVTA